MKPALPLLLVLAAVACQEEAPDRVVDLTVPVTVQPVDLGTIESVISTTGTLRALGSADLLVEVRGDLHYVAGPSGRKPVAGTWVKAGQQIARIENEEHVNSIRMTSRELAHENAQNRLTERQALFEEGLELASEVQAARKAVADAEADLADGGLQLDKLNVYAPLSGFLAELADTTESTLAEQGAVIGKVVDYNGVLVDLLIPNSQIAAIARGQEVRVSNYAMRDRVFAGRVSVLDPTLDPTTRTFRVEVAVENPDRALRPGMFVRAEVVVERRAEVITIPKELVLTRQNRLVVFVEEEGRAQQRFIETGLEDDRQVEVLEGLAAGERLITSNYETLRSRTQVRVTGQSGQAG